MKIEFEEKKVKKISINRGAGRIEVWFEMENGESEYLTFRAE